MGNYKSAYRLRTKVDQKRVERSSGSNTFYGGSPYFNAR